MNEDPNDHDDDMDTYRNLPVFKQSEIIIKIIECIIDGIPLADTPITSDYDKALFRYHSGCMMENALLLPLKIIETHQSDLYDAKMESATLIRKAAQDILKDAQGLQRSGYEEIDYLNILRDNIEIFRPLFAKWVKTFNPDKYIIDRWGLFNPAGVNFEEIPQTENSKADFPSFLGKNDKDQDGLNEDDDSSSLD